MPFIFVFIFIFYFYLLASAAVAARPFFLAELEEPKLIIVLKTVSHYFPTNTESLNYYYYEFLQFFDNTVNSP